MNEFTKSTTLESSLEEVIASLATNNSVIAVLQIGSLSRDQLTPASDYDLIIIVDGIEPLWYVGVTQIEYRLTDLIFVNSTAIKAILDLEAPLPQEDELTPIIRWLRDGRILFARTQTTLQAKQKVQNGRWLKPVSDKTAYDTWFSINYNLAQLRRMIMADDPLYKQVAAIRMAVYAYSDLWFGYFTLRKLDWAGDKAAYRYLQEHDLLYLQTYQQLIHSQAGLWDKFVIYEKIVALATAPVGCIWPNDVTIMNHEQQSALWQELLDYENQHFAKQAVLFSNRA